MIDGQRVLSTVGYGIVEQSKYVWMKAAQCKGEDVDEPVIYKNGRSIV